MARETKQFLDAYPDSPQKADALHLRAAALAWEGRLEESLAAAEQFIALRPDDDERGAYLLETVAEKTTDPARWRELNGRIVETFKGKRVAKWAAARLRRADGVGKPFNLSFNDAVTGKPLAMADLKGKVVVVDFWATWCGPCVAEMPKMKQLYADYKDKGVEFIGVSLDQPVKDGGLEKLRLFVAENKITWPQYHQGGGWDSEFSASWGVQSVPTTFMVGADGNLHSTDASGKVEQLLIDLLEKRDGRKRASTQRL